MRLKISDKFLGKDADRDALKKELQSAFEKSRILQEKKGKGAEFLGWLDLPGKIKSEISEIEKAVERISAKAEYLVVIGIGGSYLGARAVIEAASPFFEKKKGMKILYAGHHLDASYHSELLEFLKDKEFAVNVISKSGTTTEPALAFRYILSLAEKKYGRDGLKDRIIATTDARKGALKKLADSYGFQTFVIPDDVGGRYSFLTPVGLIPIAAAGLNIKELVNGAADAADFLFREKDPSANPGILYAALRNYLYKKGKSTEIMVSYSPKFYYLTEWWKQLYGESEGKERKGIFPAGVSFTTDLHSMGQYIQDGERHLFETVVSLGRPEKDLTITDMAGDPDGLNYLSGKTMYEVNEKAVLGTKLAHLSGGTPSIEISLADFSLYSIGELMYMFEYACGVSGYMLDVNPFDQPGVEDYKNNMFALLGKKGYEEIRAKAEKNLSEL
ncbi:MAG TPA: glucose-6-phosphate isomerase [Leptospiraceae bacterium]|nr:glucose-6-phosphate isomerase [Leptospiraceae bacterium]HNF15751.1 glucose-6-phosphate isomerase [Leptospiraceae bacterium]HNF26267.1 glucose-6-phosphate isomerase [Leptospiraceae bacterium]HNM03520.1 glucose-6-phosphate isomerase [Leptospiraceae bacterium]HNN05546.1 glucose-6-phosphate isomerase [Leptospiraceae bacterium]